MRNCDSDAMTAKVAQTVEEVNEQRRSKRLESRRELILRAAAEEFAQMGYERATLERIGERVGLSKASIYHYVDGKEDLLAELFARVATEIQERATAELEASADAVARLAAFVRAHVEVSCTTPQGRVVSENLAALLTKDASAQTRRSYEAVLDSILEAGVDEGVFRVDGIRMTTKLLFGALNTFPAFFDPHGSRTAREFADGALELALNGLLTRPGSARRGPRSRPGLDT